MPPKKGGKKGAKAAIKEEVPEIELRDPYAGSEELVAQLDAKTIGDRILRLYAFAARTAAGVSPPNSGKDRTDC